MKVFKRVKKGQFWSKSDSEPGFVDSPKKMPRMMAEFTIFTKFESFSFMIQIHISDESSLILRHFAE